MQKIIIYKGLGPRVARLGVFGFAIIASNLWAGTSAIDGVVKDANGQPLSGADIRIEAKGGRSWNKVVKTDAKGHYLYSGLTAGAEYRVSLLVAGVVKASINNVQIKPRDPTHLNFDLKKSVASGASATAKKGRHYVYIPAQTGSHMGGRWVEVDDNGQASAAGANNVQTATGEAMKKMQMQTDNRPNTGGGSGN